MKNPTANHSESATELLERVDFMHLPIGVYVIDLDGHFYTYNDGVREILGIAKESASLSSIKDYYANPNTFGELIDVAAEDGQDDNRFEKSLLHFNVRGEDVFAENYIKPLRDADRDEIIGFLGCMAEVTDEHREAQRSGSLQQKVEELTYDIGRILHANTSTLVMVNQTLEACAAALSDNVSDSKQKNDPSHLAGQKAVAQFAEQLANSVDRLLAAVSDQNRRRLALPEDQWDTVAQCSVILRDYRERIPVEEMWTPTLRIAATKLTDACRSIAAGHLPRELVRTTLRNALELQRATCLQEVVSTKTVVAQMDYTLRSLRDFITTEVRIHEVPKRLLVDDVVREAVKQLGDFANACHVRIEWRDRQADADILGIERNIVRALSNLLHNAIKYSWHREQSSGPWIAVRTGKTDRKVFVEFENWGVPIMAEEIERGLIFEIGYRGQLSTDRGRLGTGIGLTDSQQTAVAHGGNIEIKSRPATDSGLGPDDSSYFKTPFLTTVRIVLPRANLG